LERIIKLFEILKTDYDEVINLMQMLRCTKRSWIHTKRQSPLAYSPYPTDDIFWKYEQFLFVLFLRYTSHIAEGAFEKRYLLGPELPRRQSLLSPWVYTGRTTRLSSSAWTAVAYWLEQRPTNPCTRPKFGCAKQHAVFIGWAG